MCSVLLVVKALEYQYLQDQDLQRDLTPINGTGYLGPGTFTLLMFWTYISHKRKTDLGLIKHDFF